MSWTAESNAVVHVAGQEKVQINIKPVQVVRVGDTLTQRLRAINLSVPYPVYMHIHRLAWQVDTLVSFRLWGYETESILSSLMALDWSMK